MLLQIMRRVIGLDRHGTLQGSELPVLTNRVNVKELRPARIFWSRPSRALVAPLAATVAVLTGASATLRATPAAVHPEARAKTLVSESINALGGEERLRSIRTLTLVGSSYTNHLQDSPNPRGPWLVDFDRFTEYQDLRQRTLLRDSAANPASARATATTLHRELVAEGIDAHLTIENAIARVDYTTAAHDDWIDLGPLRVMLTALHAPDLHVSASRRLHGIPTTVVTFRWQGLPVKIFINDFTKLPLAVEYFQSYPDSVARAAWGDMAVRTTYSNWELEPGGLHYPLQTDTTLNGQPLKVVSLTKVSLGTGLAADQFTVTSAIRGDYAQETHDVDRIPLGQRGNGDPGLPPREICPGVVQIPGEWYVTLIRQHDGVIVLEAPISGGYSAKVIEEAGRRFPGERIKAIISTSNYWWHIAGVREYVADGIPLYALDLNRELLSHLSSAPHLTHPDSLQRSPRMLDLRAVTGKQVLGKGVDRVALYPIRTSTTSQMLMVYFPQCALLYSSDMAQPLGKNGAFVAPQYLWDLKRAVDENHLHVETLIGMHMSPTPWAKLLKTLVTAKAFTAGS